MLHSIGTIAKAHDNSAFIKATAPYCTNTILAVNAHKVPSPQSGLRFGPGPAGWFNRSLSHTYNAGRPDLGTVVHLPKHPFCNCRIPTHPPGAIFQYALLGSIY